MVGRRREIRGGNPQKHSETMSFSNTREQSLEEVMITGSSEPPPPINSLDSFLVLFSFPIMDIWR